MRRAEDRAADRMPGKLLPLLFLSVLRIEQMLIVNPIKHMI